MQNISQIIDNVNLSSPCGTIVRNYKPIRYDLNLDHKVHPEVDQMHREAQWFINDVINRVRPMRWLSLLGSSGIGKTHLARAIIDTLKRERPDSIIQFWSWSKVVAMLRDGEWGLIQHLIDNPFVLALDDIGVTNESAITIAAMNRLADARLGKWTIFTSNLSAENINKQIDTRVASRLYRGNNVICECSKAQDYSFEKYKQQQSQC